MSYRITTHNSGPLAWHWRVSGEGVGSGCAFTRWTARFHARRTIRGWERQEWRYERETARIEKTQRTEEYP